MKILIVDDDEVVRLLLRHLLVEKFKCTVLQAKNGLEGWDTVQKEDPDLVFLDITMPVMDGKEMLELIRSDASYAELPVVILSAVSEKPKVTKLIVLGITDYLLKPLYLQKIIPRIEKVLSIIKSDEKKNRSDMVDDAPEGTNPKALALIRKLGSDKLVHEMIESFLTHVPLRMKAAHHGLKTGDAAAVEIAVHTLKSSSGQLGAVAMQALCEEAESLAVQKKIEMIPPALEKIEEEFPKVKAWLEKAMSGTKEET